MEIYYEMYLLCDLITMIVTLTLDIQWDVFRYRRGTKCSLYGVGVALVSLSFQVIYSHLLKVVNLWV